MNIHLDHVDIKSLVVSGLATDRTTLSNFFQRVGRKELAFLVNSGFGVDFVRGIFLFPLPPAITKIKLSIF